MIEMNGAVTGLLTSEGHRDEIEIRRGYKEEGGRVRLEIHNQPVQVSLQPATLGPTLIP